MTSLKIWGSSEVERVMHENYVPTIKMSMFDVMQPVNLALLLLKQTGIMRSSIIDFKIDEGLSLMSSDLNTVSFLLV